MRPRRILLLLPLAAALLLAGDLLQLTGSTFAWTVVLAIAFAVFAGGLGTWSCAALGAFAFDLRMDVADTSGHP